VHFTRQIDGKYRRKKTLNSLEFLVVQEIFMSETAKFANVVLPGASFFEKNGTPGTPPNFSSHRHTHR